MPQSRHRYLIAAIAFAAVIGYGCVTAHAEVLELEGTVKSVDKDARTISVVRKTAQGEKTLELEVAKKACTFSEVEEGGSVAFSYDPRSGTHHEDSGEG